MWASLPPVLNQFDYDLMLRGQLMLNRFNNVSLSRQFYLIGFIAPEGELLSFARPRQLLLHCSTSCIHAVEKKVTKEKAARLPLASCAPRFRRGLPKGTPVSLATRFIHEAPLRAVPDESCGARRGKRDETARVRNISYDEIVGANSLVPIGHK
ncbi:hypothetical protein [Methylobacter marinus]|uniref:hypothetical protein n=1 Tax=Methylobacter marinus TaxID=34058 RepID=UPI000481C8B0|nr:hypothetical protein [Methylobacter marinus]